MKNKKTPVVTYSGTNLLVFDLGPLKSPRFELYDIKQNKTILKSDSPKDFNKIVEKEWKKKGLIE